MDDTIPEKHESDTRMECLAAASCLNQLREKPHECAQEIIADAALFEHYVSQGQSVAIYCDNALAVTIRG